MDDDLEDREKAQDPNELEGLAEDPPDPEISELGEKYELASDLQVRTLYSTHGSMNDLELLHREKGRISVGRRDGLAARARTGRWMI